MSAAALRTVVAALADDATAQLDADVSAELLNARLADAIRDMGRLPPPRRALFVNLAMLDTESVRRAALLVSQLDHPEVLQAFGAALANAPDLDAWVYTAFIEVAAAQEQASMLRLTRSERTREALATAWFTAASVLT